MTAAPIKTDRQTLLAAARRGDFRAVLALADLWAETPGCERQAERWGRLVAACRWVLGRTGRHRVRMGALRATALHFRDFAFDVNKLEGRPWNLCAPWVFIGVPDRELSEGFRSRDTPAARALRHGDWNWCLDVADALIRHVKATITPDPKGPPPCPAS